MTIPFSFLGLYFWHLCDFQFFKKIIATVGVPNLKSDREAEIFMRCHVKSSRGTKEVVPSSEKKEI